MKNTLFRSLALSSLLVLTACAGTHQNVKTDPIADISIDDILTERAIANASIGGELLVQLVRNASGSAEKSALIKLIERAAATEGLTVARGLSEEGLGLAFTKEQSAKIVSRLALSRKDLFMGQNQVIAQEASATLAELKAAKVNASTSTTLSSGINLMDKETQATVRNLYAGFDRNKDFVKVYIAVKHAGVDLWSDATCTVKKKLTITSSNTLLNIGKEQAAIAKQVVAEATGEKATACMINRGAAGVMNYFVNELHVPTSELIGTMEAGARECHLFPESYVVAAKQISAKGGALPAPSDISCN